LLNPALNQPSGQLSSQRFLTSRQLHAHSHDQSWFCAWFERA